MMEYLFLCSMGENRSPTAAAVASRLAKEKGLDIEMSYGGIDCVDSAKPGLLEHFNGFDRIFVMEQYMQRKLIDWGIDRKKVICLYIENIYKRNDYELVRILENSLRVEMSWDLKNP